MKHSKEIKIDICDITPKKYYRPYSNIRKHLNDQDINLVLFSIKYSQIAGGVIGSLRSLIALYFVFVTIFWWVLIKIFNVQILNVPNLTLLHNYFFVYPSILFSSFYAYELHVYHANRGLYRSILECVVTAVTYIQKIKLILMENSDLNETVRENLADLYFVFKSFPYVIKHMFRGKLRIHNIRKHYGGLPMPRKLKNKIILKVDDTDEKVMPQYKYRRIVEHIVKILHTLSRESVLSQADASSIEKIIVDLVDSKISQLSNSLESNLPDIVKQSLSITAIMLYTFAIPSLWQTYGFGWGTAMNFFVIGIFVSMVEGLVSMKNIFDDPDYNRTIYGETVGKYGHKISNLISHLFHGLFAHLNLVLNETSNFNPELKKK